MKSLKIIGYILATLLLMVCTKQANAQLTGLQSMYFDNQYLANPAMAGLNKGLNLNLGYQRQWTNIPGSPKLENGTADYNAGGRVGLGTIIYNDQSGLISRTRVMGTYAYHLPVNETGKLNFGLSVGVNDTYIDYSKIVGDDGDQSVGMFNSRSMYVDGDLGVSYINNGLSIQAVLPNLGSVIFNTEGTNLDVDRATFFTSVSYQFPLSTLNDDVFIEPKMAFRGVKGFSNIVDGGFNLMMKQYNINVSAMYHSNQSISAGLGINLKPVGLLLSYTSNTGSLKSYANNTFELGVKYSIFN